MANSASARLRFEPPVCLVETPGTPHGRLHAIAPQLESARQALVAAPPSSLPAPKPAATTLLDWNWLDRPRQLLDGYNHRRATSHLFAILKAAHRLRDTIDRVVVVGASADLAGAQALMGACADPHFNDLDRGGRGSRARLHFISDELDNDSLQALLRLVGDGRPAATLDQRWALVAVLPRQPNLALALAIRHLLAALEKSTGGDSRQVGERFLPIGGPPQTSVFPPLPAGYPPQTIGDQPQTLGGVPDAWPSGNLPPRLGPDLDWEQGHAGTAAQWAAQLGCVDAFPADEHEPTGPLTALAAPSLLPAALLGIDIVRLLTGAVAFNDHFLTAPPGANPALDFAATALLLADDQTTPSLSNAPAYDPALPRPLHLWAQALRQPGHWWETLFAASRRCRFLTHIIVDEWRSDPLPAASGEYPDRPPVSLTNRSFPELMRGAAERAIAAARLSDRPLAILRMPRVDEWSVGQFFQMMMNATAIEQRVLDAARDSPDPARP